MEINMGMRLPHAARTVGVARHLCRAALRELGVDDSCTSDIEGALSEACTNVLDHSQPGSPYGVAMVLTETCCVIKVSDGGPGFDPDGLAAPDPQGESGRGIQMMRALADGVSFELRPDEGTVVRLEKQLTYAARDAERS